MNVYTYRAIPMDLLEKPKGVFGRISDRLLRFFRLRRGHRVTYKWVEEMGDKEEEGTIEAASWEEATLKLISERRLYPIELSRSVVKDKNRKRHNLNDIKDFLIDKASR